MDPMDAHHRARPSVALCWPTPNRRAVQDGRAASLEAVTPPDNRGRSTRVGASSTAGIRPSAFSGIAPRLGTITFRREPLAPDCLRRRLGRLLLASPSGQAAPRTVNEILRQSDSQMTALRGTCGPSINTAVALP
jgi:hypothetical protein